LDAGEEIVSLCCVILPVVPWHVLPLELNEEGVFVNGVRCDRRCGYGTHPLIISPLTSLDAWSRIRPKRMKIKVYASVKEKYPTPGPYKTIDIVERDSPYQVGDMTHYGEVILLLPPDVLNEGVEQGV